MGEEPKQVSEVEQLTELMHRMYSEASRVRELTHTKLKSVMKARPEPEPKAEMPLDTWSPLFTQMRRVILDTLTEIQHIQQSIADTELPG